MPLSFERRLFILGPKPLELSSLRQVKTRSTSSDFTALGEAALMSCGFMAPVAVISDRRPAHLWVLGFWLF